MKFTDRTVTVGIVLIMMSPFCGRAQTLLIQFRIHFIVFSRVVWLRTNGKVK